MENDRYKNLLLAIEEERKSEEKYYYDIANQKSSKEKIESGILIPNLVITKKYYTIGEMVEIRFSYNKPYNRPNKFKVGVGVQVVYTAESEVRIRGTLSAKKKDSISVIIPHDVLSRDLFPDNGTYALEIIYDERPYKVMKQALLDVISSKEPNIVELREGIRKQSILDENHYLASEKYYIPEYVNENQRQAIQGALTSGQMTIIHGPPGTGKTTTLVALIKTLASREKKILVCAPSNNAVDLLALKANEQGLDVVRIGNVTRMDDKVAELSIDEKARNHPDWNHVKSIKIEAEAARKMASTRKRKFGTDERRHRKEMYKESRDLKKWARDMQDKLISDIVNKSQVIATTLIGCSARQIENLVFDTVIIDEASQAMEPECWNAILKGKRVILAGDHHQLPPTVKSNTAKEMGLATTILDRMSDVIKHTYLLTLQYRMNDKILGFSNSSFYDGKLESYERNKKWTLDNDENPLVFIDTSGCGFDEKFNEKSRSITNEGEYFIAREVILKHKEIFTEEVSIGFIAAYAEQVRYIRDQISEDDVLRSMDIQVNSIDGFQGQEKDVIIISLTRSNEMGIIGFLSDYRRINVAMTRAKKKLIIIGDGATLCSNSLYNDLIEHVEKNGLLQSGWEYMS